MKKLIPLQLFFAVISYVLTMISLNAQENFQESSDNLKSKSPELLIFLIKYTEPEKAAVYEKELLQLNIPDTAKIKAYFDIRKHFYNEDNHKRSRYYVHKAMNLARTLKNKTLLGKAYQYLGNSYLLGWDNYKSLEAYYVALDIAENTKNVKQEIIIRINIAIILKRVSNPKKALEVCKATLRIIDETQKNTRNHARMLTIISDVSLKMGDYEKVLEYAEKGIGVSDSLGYNRGLAFLYAEKGAALYYKKDYDKAHYFLKTAKNTLDTNRIPFKTLSVNIDYFSALVSYDQKAYKNAIHILEQITMSSDTISGYPRFIESHKWLSKCYKESGNIELALYWREEYEKLQERFAKEKNEINYKIGKRLENYIQNLQKKEHDLKNKNKYVSILLIFILLILAGVTILYFRKQRSDKKRFDALMEKIALLEQQEQQPKEKATTVIIDDTTVNKVLEKITRLETQQYFLSVECSLRAMGKKVKTNATYLSKIINDHKGKNFNDYINELRIDYVLKRIKNDEKFRRFSVQGIAAETGYKSVNSFTKHFKSKTGLNPSYYIRNIDKLSRR